MNRFRFPKTFFIRVVLFVSVFEVLLNQPFMAGLADSQRFHGSPAGKEPARAPGEEHY